MSSPSDVPGECHCPCGQYFTGLEEGGKKKRRGEKKKEEKTWHIKTKLDTGVSKIYFLASSDKGVSQFIMNDKKKMQVKPPSQ